MKKITRTSVVLILIFTVIAASLFAAHIPPLWLPFTLSSLIMTAALFALRRMNKVSLTSADSSKNPLHRFNRLVVQEIVFLEDFLTQSHLAVNVLEDRLERQFTEVENLRVALMEVFGMARYVALITPFAQAERLQYRGLSAALDGYDEEARRSLSAAQHYLQETQLQLDSAIR